MNFPTKGLSMNDSDSRYDDLERTDVLPQLALQADQEDNIDGTARLALPAQLNESVKPFGIAAHNGASGRVSALPAKPSTTDLAVGGIRGKISDLENRLIEAQDRHIDLKHQCEQWTRRCGVAEARAAKAEASYVQQSSELHHVELQASEAQQRLQEERVRFQAKIAEAEQQLVHTRTRGDKRVAALEQLLSEQTGLAALSERAASEACVEIEKARGEVKLAQTAIRGLEERLAEQTQAASEVTRIYSQQTSQVAVNAELIVAMEKKLAESQAENTASDTRITGLESQVQNANAALATLQSEIAVKLRHIAALEQGLASRDESIDALKTQLASIKDSTAELITAKSALDERCAELEQAVAAARGGTATSEREIARLNTALRGNDTRINELTAALRAADTALKDRDTTIAEVAGRADATRIEYAQVVEQANALRRRLDESEQHIDGLQAQLVLRTDELTAAQESARVSQTRQAEVTAEMCKLGADLDETLKAMGKIMAERNQLETENQAGRAELGIAQARYQEAAQTVVAVRGSIAIREQKNAALERELRAASLQLKEANDRITRVAATTEEFNAELRQRDNRIALLEQKCADQASALNDISQDVERVNSANPSERLAAMGYALEALDQTGTIHRMSRSTTTVGRAATNDVSIDSTSVSRYHARIVVQPEGVWLIDLQSTNGCGVNGRRISRQILCDGDVVMIGHCKFRFSALGASKDEPAPNEEFPLFDEPLLIPKAHGADHDVSREQHH
jgi:pSer/pThr/pTyr-binding forkhead associated (FHA) protein